jgi:phenylpyruvate tautomerase PptA (4-oxalocrotonate tautomerase family)
MPILTYQLIEGQHTPARLRTPLVESSALYARVLESPIDRIRVFINLRPPHLVAVAGVPVDEQSVCAPFFDCLVLAGRPLAQRHQLLEALLICWFRSWVRNVNGSAAYSIVRYRPFQYPGRRCWWAIAMTRYSSSDSRTTME